MHLGLRVSLIACLSLVPVAGCFEEVPPSTVGDDDTTTTTGDGDGDPTTSGDGDGDPTTSGDGDGDPTTSGDGDGDPTTSGDGDGDPTTSGDGDGDGDPCAECGPLQLCHMDMCVPAAQVIYLNFEGEGNFVYSANEPSDARINRHNLNAAFVGNGLTGFNGDDFERQQILDFVRKDFDGLRVVVTDERPMSGEYSMVVFTVDPNMNPNAVGFPSTDCGDTNANDVSIIFMNLAPITNQQKSNFVSKQVAGFAGIESLLAEDAQKPDIMYPYLVDIDPSFTPECRPLNANPKCPNFDHSIHCNNMGGVQSSAVELNASWGF